MLWRKESDVGGTRKAAKDNRPFRIQPSKPAHLLLELVSLGLSGEQPENLSWEKALESLFSTGTCTEWRGTERVKEMNPWFRDLLNQKRKCCCLEAVWHMESLLKEKEKVTFEGPQDSTSRSWGSDVLAGAQHPETWKAHSCGPCTATSLCPESHLLPHPLTARLAGPGSQVHSPGRMLW